MVYLIPVLCFVAALIAAVLAMRHGLGWVVAAMAAAAVLAMVWAIRSGQQQQGWDAIGYAIVAALMAAPALLGTLVGGGIGWWRQRRQARRDG